uniref:Mu-conotoxin SIIIB n=2 Tax=Conus striatus TaxID=6493 RepID=CM3B_CONST|nr:RecName: Full=Mu-conotoxin SIIIB [Conus striatus]
QNCCNGGCSSKWCKGHARCC